MASQLAERLAALIARQRTAIIARDVEALGQIHGELAQLLGERSRESRVVSRQKGPSPRLATRDSRLTDLHDQIRLNRVLLANGMLIADRFIDAAATSGQTIDDTR